MDSTGARWRKSSFSGQNSNCVEVAAVGGRVKLRDAKNSLGPTIAIPAAHWKILLTTL